jgi:hypothetical protein
VDAVWSIFAHLMSALLLRGFADVCR